LIFITYGVEVEVDPGGAGGAGGLQLNIAENAAVVGSLIDIQLGEDFERGVEAGEFAVDPLVRRGGVEEAGIAAEAEEAAGEAGGAEHFSTIPEEAGPGVGMALHEGAVYEEKFAGFLH